MSVISAFITENKWDLLGFQCRYGNFYIFGGFNYILMQRMDDWLNGADMEGVAMQFYLANEGAWLACGFGRTFDEALHMIEYKMKNHKEDDKWKKAQWEFYDWFVNFSGLSSGFELDNEKTKKGSPLLYESYRADGSFPFDPDTGNIIYG